MKCEWHRISDYVSSGEIEIRTGPFGTQLRASDYVASGIPVINVRNIGYGTINEEKLEYIDEPTAMRLSMHLLRTNDIVFGRKGAVDRHAFIIEKYNGWLQGSDCIRLRVNTKKLLPQYLSYYFLTKRHKGFMESMCSHGSTMASLNQKILEKIEFPYVSVENQMKIVEVLSAIDRKVMVNRNINANLQQQAQAIFKSWFVDFEPFGGVKPNSWIVSTLGEVTEMSAGGDKPKNISCTKSAEFPYPIYSNGLEKEGLYGYTDKAKIFAESVTVSARGTIGFVCLRHIPYVPIVRLITLLPKGELLSAKYLYLFLKQSHISGTGTTQQQLTVPNFRKAEILIPDKAVMDEFTKIVAPMYTEIWINEDENIRLSLLRDALLPKLMGGEIDISGI